ncbi:uncharacterized protein LOC126751521 isoform X1 [Bactrocera neohumeralis]|uniref:uncharacterized protein LOC126751521 isoform X1 n=1 Tax=Bactrocera neohumeralis TaxID=98809 RepID=UPI00216645B6|nr:uncharacterized protein LOC126751521 isoform X1 [Bactrocera neohumeralis]
MKITLPVLLATLTIYCGATVLSLPPSLIATAASLARHHVRQTRDSRRSATITADATTIHLPQQHTYAVANPQPLQWQAVRPKKDATGFRLDGGNVATNGYTGTNTNSDDILGLSSMDSNNNAGIKLTHPFKVSGNLADGKDAYDLNALLAGAAESLKWKSENAQQAHRRQQQQPRSAQWWHIQAPRIRAMQMKEFFTPLKYWAHHCQPPEHNCPQEYYRALLADRSRAAAAEAKLMDDFTAKDGEKVKVKQATTSASAANEDDDVNVNAHAFAQNDGGGIYDSMDNINDDGAVDNVYSDADAVAEMSYDEDEDNNASNDILLLLSGEQDVMKFLSWAMQQLYPYQHFPQLNGSEGAEYYYPGMFNWKKLNLSGHLEPPLVVEEPHYVIVRREQLEDDLPPGIRIEDRKPKQRSALFQNIFNLNHGPQYKDDPFIPPRGRKHNLPDLDALLNRYETFVPNRGKRDKIKDIFKYDDLFFPNRGKKQGPPKAATVPHSGDDRANEVNTAEIAPEGNVDDGGQTDGRRAFLLSDQVDRSDDSNLTVSPAAVAISRLLAGWMKCVQPHELCVQLKRAVDVTRDGNASGIQRSGFEKNNDDNSNNNGDIIDSDIAVSDGYSSGNGGWPDRMARFRRVPTTFGGITRIAANRLRSMPTTIKSAERQQNKSPTRRQGRLPHQQPAMLRYFIRQLRQKQAQRRGSWQWPLLTNQVRTNINDLDLLTWRQQHQDNMNKPLTAQHSSLQQEQVEQPKGQQTEHHHLQHLLGGVSGITAGRSSPETADVGGI